jgi:phage terminase small subunit
VDEYLVHLNARRAYQAVHPNAGANTAAVAGCRLLKNPNVRAEVRAAIEARSRATRVNSRRVLRELGRIAFSDLGCLFDAKGRLLPFAKIPLKTRASLAEVQLRRVRQSVTRRGKTTTVETEEIISCRLADKLAALGKLARCLGLFQAAATPIEVLLSRMPPELAAQVRAWLATQERDGANGPGDSAPSDSKHHPGRAASHGPSTGHGQGSGKRKRA